MKELPKSMAVRVSAEDEEPKLDFEEEARLTTDEITRGVQQAREAMNEPTLDLLAFEQALKKKHDQLKSAGITPVLTMPKPKYKVGI